MPPRPAHRTVAITPRLFAWLISGLVAAALTGGATFLALVPGTGGVVIDSEIADTALTDRSLASGVSDASTGGPGVLVAPPVDLVVDVEGAVAHPGLVHIPTGGRVGDALTRAGGFAANADLTRTAAELNLAQTVTDGLKVVVPIIGVPSVGDDTSNDGLRDTRSAAGSQPLDLNQATEAQLDTLPGVGAATIAKIVAARQSTPFTSTEDLRTRKIVGDAAYQRLTGLITVRH